LNLKTSIKKDGNAGPSLKPDLYIFLLIFPHKWMFLSTMQTLPNQIPLGPAEIISLLSSSVIEVFILVEYWRILVCWCLPSLHY